MIAATRLASAQAPDAEALIQRGRDLRRIGRDEDALVVFRLAWDQFHTAHARAAIGLAEAALSRWSDAAADLDAALAMQTDPWIMRNRSELVRVQTIVAQHLGSLEVRVNVPGAEVLLDGRMVATLPLSTPLRVAPGARTLLVRAPGYVTVTQSVVVEAGVVVRAVVNLSLIPGLPVVVQRPEEIHTTLLRRPTTNPVTARDDMTAIVEAAEAAPTGQSQRVAAWMTGGFSIAFLAVGSVTAFMQNRSARLPRVRECGGHDTCLYACRYDFVCNAQYVQQERLRVTAWVGFIGAGVLAATSALLFLTGPSTSSRQRRVVFACGPGPGSPGVLCSLAF